MKNLRERRREMLREEILNAAQELLLSKGFAAMSMDELASVVGISKPTLYDYFDSKETLAVEVIIAHLRWFVHQVHQRPPERSPLTHLLYLMREVQRASHNQGPSSLHEWSPEFARLIIDHPQACDFVHSIHTDISSLVQEARLKGEIDSSLSVDAVVLAFHNHIHAIRIRHLHRVTWQDDVQTCAESLIRMFERSVRPGS